jgi:hypothetical protein
MFWAARQLACNPRFDASLLSGSISPRIFSLCEMILNVCHEASFDQNSFLGNEQYSDPQLPLREELKRSFQGLFTITKVESL